MHHWRMKDDRDRDGGGGGGVSDMMKFVWDTLDFYGHAWCQCSGSGEGGGGVPGSAGASLWFQQ